MNENLALTTDGDLDEKNRIIVSGDSFLTAKIKERPFLVDKIIPENAITALTADSGKGKSLFMLLVAKHVALGQSLFDAFEVKQANVLILDLEMDEDIIISRYKSLINQGAPIYYFHSQSFDINDPEDFAWLLCRIAEYNFKLIIFDTISNVHSCDENSAKEMKEVNKQLLRIINLTQTTILYLHHHRKKGIGENYSQSSARGSTEIMAKCASHLLLDSKKEINENGNSILKITVEQFKSRRPDGINKIGFNIIYNPETKQSTYEYVGEIDEKGQSLNAAKEFLGSFMQLGTDYTINTLKIEKKNQGLKFGENILRMACKELVAEHILDSRKGTGKEWNKDYYFKTF